MQTQANTSIRWRPEPGAVLGFHKGLARTVLIPVHDLERRMVQGVRFRFPADIEQVVGPSLASDRRVLATACERAHTTSAPARSFAVPETLHIELMGACPLECPCCYLDRGSSAPLPWYRLCEILQEAIDIGVLQVAFGGGEPLGYSHLEDAVMLVASRGVGVSITTSGIGADRVWLSRLRSAGVDHLQVSVPEQPSSRDARFAEAPWVALAAARAVGLRTGINIIASTPCLDDLPALAAIGISTGASNVNLLRPKPVARDNNGWFERNRLHGDGWRRLAASIARIRSEMPGIRLTLDSALGPVVSLLGPRYRPRPAAGCAAGRRFAAIDKNGHFKACSHFEVAETAGSLLEYWISSPVLAELRSLEEMIDRKCRGCPDLRACRGCRAIAGGNAADSDCWRN